MRFVLLTLILGVLTFASAGAAEDPPPAQVQVVTVPELVQGKDARWWMRRAQQARRDANARRDTIRRLRRVLAFSPTFSDAVQLAATVYRVSADTLRRKGLCESHGRATAENSSSHAKGAWQFLDSTWAGTPFASFSPFDLYANALAAAWMHAKGRGGEWACR